MSSIATRPHSVRYAVICLWVSVSLTLLVTNLEIAGLVNVEGPTGTGLNIAIGIITILFKAWITIKISVGRGWARWLFTIVCLTGSLGTILLLIFSPDKFQAQPILLLVNMAAQFILDAAALILLFSGASRSWFKQMIKVQQKTQHQIVLKS